MANRLTSYNIASTWTQVASGAIGVWIRRKEIDPRQKIKMVIVDAGDTAPVGSDLAFEVYTGEDAVKREMSISLSEPFDAYMAVDKGSLEVEVVV